MLLRKMKETKSYIISYHVDNSIKGTIEFKTFEEFKTWFGDYKKDFENLIIDNIDTVTTITFDGLLDRIENKIISKLERA